MGERTGIAWCDSTFNPWIGCTKVGPGCDHCYAERDDGRYRWGGATHWGPGVPRHRTSAANWKKPPLWDRIAADHGKAHRVFCASLADVFDNEAPAEWRADLWALIDATPNLTWLLLTKRIGNVMGMVPDRWRNGFPGNVWQGATVVTQDELERDAPKLTSIPARVRWLSIEPQVEEVSVIRWLDGIQWVITGGESGPQARAYSPEWARLIVQQCAVAGKSAFVKQLGSRARLKHRAGADPSEWPQDLRIQEFPHA